jgi:hypothetical protein
MNQPETPRMDRRVAIKWMLAAAATLSLRDMPGLGAATIVTANGYGQDPDLLREYHPGELWPLTFTAAERRACAALCDVVIPADEHSPSAAALGVPDFIDEWISAPYPDQRRDRPVIVEGLAWIDAETRRRFKTNFADASAAQKTALCDDICHEPKAAAEFKSAARFFARFRDLTATGFYTTPEGMKDAGYTGNTPLPSFNGPPPEALKRVGLA